MTKRSVITFGLGCLLLLGLTSCGKKYKMHRDAMSRTESWSCSRGSLGQTGARPSDSFSGRLTIRWMQGSSGKPAGPLSIHNGALVYPESKRRFKYFDLESGRKLGTYKAKGVPQTGLAVADTLAFYGVSPKKSFVRAINLLRGKRLWQRDVKDAHGGPIIVGNRLIISSGDGLTLALDLVTGEPIWSYRADRRLSASASYAEGRLFQPADRGELIALSVDNGSELFRTELEGPLVSPVAVTDNVYVADMLGHVYAVDPSDGDIIWQTKLDGPVWSSPAVAEGQLIVGHSGGAIIALEAGSGKKVWQREVSSVVRASPLILGDFVVAGTMTGKLLVLAREDGTVVDSTTVKGAINVAPVTDGRRVYVATQAGKIICFGENNEQPELAHHRVTPEDGPQ